MKKLTLLLSLVLSIAFMSSAAMAQDVPALDPSEVDGLESAYGRMYMFDVDALMASPEAAADLDLNAVALSGMASVFTFEDEGAAEDAMGDFAEQFATSFLGGAEVDVQDEAVEIDDLGDEAVMYTGTAEIDASTEADTALVIARDGENIFVTFIIGGEDVETATQDLTSYLVDGEFSDDEVTLVEDGTSTGGAFDLFPGKDDADLVGGMVPFMDIDFLEGGSFE